MRMEISNFPVLLQEDPKTYLESLNLDIYEISTTEPFHDLKGHQSNIMDESLTISSGNTYEAISTVKHFFEHCCSDQRKAIVVIYIKLNDIDRRHHYQTYIAQLLRSAIFATHDSKCTPKNILVYTTARPSVLSSLCKSTNCHETKDVWEILSF